MELLILLFQHGVSRLLRRFRLAIGISLALCRSAVWKSCALRLRESKSVYTYPFRLQTLVCARRSLEKITLPQTYLPSVSFICKQAISAYESLHVFLDRIAASNWPERRSMGRSFSSSKSKPAYETLGLIMAKIGITLRPSVLHSSAVDSPSSC